MLAAAVYVPCHDVQALQRPACAARTAPLHASESQCLPFSTLYDAAAAGAEKVAQRATQAR